MELRGIFSLQNVKFVHTPMDLCEFSLKNIWKQFLLIIKTMHWITYFFEDIVHEKHHKFNVLKTSLFNITNVLLLKKYRIIK